MRHDIGIYTALDSSGQRLNIPTHKAKVSFDFGDHGMKSARIFIPLPFSRAYSFALDTVVYYVIIWRAKGVWSGRIEDKKLVKGGVEITAYGMWNALGDKPFTGVWVDKQYKNWRVMYPSMASRFPEMYISDLENRLSIALLKNTTYVNGGNAGGFLYFSPSLSTKQLVAFSFSYDVFLPNNWKVEVYSNPLPLPLASSTLLWSLTANGGTQTGTQTLTFTADDFVQFIIYNNTGANYTMAGENGAYYARLTNVRVATTTSTNIYADEIVESMLDTAYANNAQLSNNKSFIQTPVQELDLEVYEDVSIPSTIDDLARKSTDSVVTHLFETGVYDQYLYFRSKRYFSTSGFNVWYVDVEDLDIISTIDGLYNSVYTVYQDSTNDKVRTSTTTSTTSQGIYGVKRTKAVSYSTTDSTLASEVATFNLNSSKVVTPKTSVRIKRLYYPTGGKAKLSDPRNGDTIIIRNLKGTRFSDYLKIDTFRIAEVSVNLNENTIDVTPEAPLPTVDVLLAGG